MLFDVGTATWCGNAVDVYMFNCLSNFASCLSNSSLSFSADDETWHFLKSCSIRTKTTRLQIACTYFKFNKNHDGDDETWNHTKRRIGIGEARGTRPKRKIEPRRNQWKQQEILRDRWLSCASCDPSSNQISQTLYRASPSDSYSLLLSFWCPPPEFSDLLGLWRSPTWHDFKLISSINVKLCSAGNREGTSGS